MPKVGVVTLRVLSLFDGISCGRLALDRAGISVAEYLSSEIDEAAIKVAQKNHPATIQLGDVQNLKGSAIGKVDLLIGGPPCQSFSLAGDGKGFDDPRGGLLLHWVRLLRELKPCYFLMENVGMRAKDASRVTELLRVEPLWLDSALVSAQSRKRMYWTNIPQNGQPADKGLLVKDILESISPQWPKGKPFWRYDRPTRTGVVNKGGQGDRIYSPFGKSITLSAYSGGTAGSGNMLIGYPECWRKLIDEECEALQTLPRGYTNCVSSSMRRKLIGNGWTVDAVANLLMGIKNPR